MRYPIHLTLLFALFSLASSYCLAETITITQNDKKFSVDSVTVKLGDTILFKNEEKEITHNVYSISPGNEFELRTQRPLTSTALLLDPSKHHVGEMKVECAIHPGMKVMVQVVK